MKNATKTANIIPMTVEFIDANVGRIVLFIVHTAPGTHADLERGSIMEPNMN
jgi:hypothetical protein